MGHTYIHQDNTGGSQLAILASWNRCEKAGLNQTDIVSSVPLSRAALAIAIKKNNAFLNYAVATVENTFELVEGTGSAVAVTDRSGTILFSRSDSNLMDHHGRALFHPGSCWSEATRGTNAIGVSIIERSSICVRPGEHYLTLYQSYCTCAAPILDYQGEILGAFAVLTRSESTQLHTLGFIRTTAALVENRILAGETTDRTILFFHQSPNKIGTIKQCIAVFDGDGILTGTNSAARAYLDLSYPVPKNIRFSQLFEIPFRQLEGYKRDSRTAPLILPLRDGRKVSVAPNRQESDRHGFMRIAHGCTVGGNTPAQRPPKYSTGLTLRDLDIGDPNMRRAIEKAERIIGLDLPLMIEGESGVGKEMFTRAFHNSGPRSQAPFVAVNCASIPEGLIESELFGYEEGAFTGAKRRGSVGKLLQANGGTLFLDEIGDMPLLLQGRLLRVLQEREVLPLGSTKSVPVDFSLICATHRNIRQEIAEGRFREDLYYRLNGLRILLPALRDRKDLVQLVRSIAQAEGGGRGIIVSANVMSLFQRAAWPGNIRQLHMLLRTAIALAGADNTVTMEQLPDEFLQDFVSSNARVAEPATSVGYMPSQTGELARAELLAIKRALAEAHGNISEAARVLGISRKTVYRKLGKIEALNKKIDE